MDPSKLAAFVQDPTVQEQVEEMMLTVRMGREAQRDSERGHRTAATLPHVSHRVARSLHVVYSARGVLGKLADQVIAKHR